MTRGALPGLSPAPASWAALGRAAIAVALAAIAASACTVMDEPGPQATPDSSLRLLSSAPRAGAFDVPRAGAILLTFDRAIASETVNTKTVRLFSGIIEARGALKVDLLDRTVRFVPYEPLRPRLRYRVYLAGGLRGLDGASLGDALVLDFTTGDLLGTPPGPPPVVTAAELQPLWVARCARCHGNSDPRAGLDLSSLAATKSNLVAVPSTGSFRKRVVPGDHAASYLMRKLIGLDSVDGMQMPPEPDDRLDAAALRRVANWIDSGAN